MIVQIVSLFLIFLTEAEAYFCIKTMIETSKALLNENIVEGIIGTKTLNWYITLEADDFNKMCSSFFGKIQEKSSYFNEILQFFTKHNFNFIGLFQEWIKSLFQGCFPLPVNKKKDEAKRFLIY